MYALSLFWTKLHLTYRTNSSQANNDINHHFQNGKIVKMDTHGITLIRLIPVMACQSSTLMKSRVISVTSLGWAQHHQYRLSCDATSIRLHALNWRRRGSFKKHNEKPNESCQSPILIDMIFEIMKHFSEAGSSHHHWELQEEGRSISLPTS